VGGLPVETAIPALRDALAGERAAVLVAPPGAGKTTLVPLRLLDAPWLDGRRIVVLEPRRLATRAAAGRMAHLLGTSVGELVGFQTRDERRIGPATRIEVVTEGVLTRRLQADPELPGVGLVVFDEVHERNLATDLGLALALDVRSTLRPDLRLLAMSATPQAGRLALLLGGAGGPAPVITSAGRAHPVEVCWRPTTQRVRIEEATANVVSAALREQHGDVLVFLPGIGEIRRVGALLDGVVPPEVDVHALAGALSAQDQDRALAPSPPGRRRVVLATDIAETSLTVEGVRVVVDAGLARVPRYDTRTGMTRLTTVAASRASAEQRAGRAGRTEAGVAYRLWSKLEHGTRRSHLDPEITQVDLAGLALELAAWGTASDAMAFLDPPPARTLEQGRDLLRGLGALDATGAITATGRAMLGLPLHPRLAHMVVASRESGDGWLACLLAALLDERDVLRGPPSELPADLALRIEVLAGTGWHHDADRRAVERVRERARDIARRAGIDRDGTVEVDRTGRVALLAYPDRLAAKRGRAGQLQLRTGAGAWLATGDPLAGEAFVVACDLDGNRTRARVRRGVGLDARDVAAVLADQVVHDVRLVWDRERDDLVARVERRVDLLRLDETLRPADPGPEATAALLQRVEATKLAVLPWGPLAAELRGRVALLRATFGEPWPDWSDRALLRTLDEWLAPFLDHAVGRADLERLDLAVLLRARLPWPEGADLDRLAPARLELGNGRSARLDYRDGGPPVLAARAQDLFGVTVHPTVAGGWVPVTVEVLSPAGRPIQVTSDLPGFWAGSWAEVRKEMAGRYPKHAWPADPTRASG
jgi:ATP-dependent helicase HrpB